MVSEAEKHATGGSRQGVLNRGFHDDEDAGGKQKPQWTPADSEKPTEEATEPKREQWNNKTEFMMSCVSMAVGVGNVWRFPFVALENGGGAFVIPYLLVLVFIGKPLYYLEMTLGQFSSAGVVGLWGICPAFRGIGYGQAFSTWAVSTFYVYLMAICVYFFFASFGTLLPWAECGTWASSKCLDVTSNATSYTANSTSGNEGGISAAEEYLTNEVLKLDPEGFKNGIGLPDLKLSMCLLLSWVLTFIVQAKGVKSAGKAAYFTALFPYVVLLAMLIRGVTLTGSLEGILFFITPRWEKLFTPGVWYAAVNQALFSLSIGFGNMVTLASYNNFRNNLYLDATIISLVDTVTSLLAGVTTFAILGHLANEMGVEVSQVVKGGGTSLAFISYPEALARFTVVPQLFSAMFFLMMFTLGLGSTTPYNNVIITVIGDRYPETAKWRISLAVCVVGFLVGMLYPTPQGQYIMTLVDHYSGGVSIILLVVLELIGVMWVYGLRRLTRDIRFMLGRSTGLYWKVCWGVFNPLFLGVIFVYSQIQSQTLTYGTYVFDSISTGIGLMLSVVAVALVPIVFLREVWIRYRDSKGLRHALVNTFKATDEWSPKDPVIKKEYNNLLAAETNEEQKLSPG